MCSYAGRAIARACGWLIPLAFGSPAERRQRQTSRVLRGGSWNNNDPDNLLSSNRNNNTPDNRNNNIGFRCVLVGGMSRKADEPGEVSAEPTALPSSAKQPILTWDLCGRLRSP